MIMQEEEAIESMLPSEGVGHLNLKATSHSRVESTASKTSKVRHFTLMCMSTTIILLFPCRSILVSYTRIQLV